MITLFLLVWCLCKASAYADEYINNLNHTNLNIVRSIISGTLNGLVRLENDNGIIDKRNGRVYSVVVCKKQDEKWFSERQ